MVCEFLLLQFLKLSNITLVHNHPTRDMHETVFSCIYFSKYKQTHSLKHCEP